MRRLQAIRKHFILHHPPILPAIKKNKWLRFFFLGIIINCIDESACMFGADPHQCGGSHRVQGPPLLAAEVLPIPREGRHSPLLQLRENGGWLKTQQIREWWVCS